MKKIYFLSLICFFQWMMPSQLLAQRGKKDKDVVNENVENTADKQNIEFQHQMQVYHMSLKYNDLATAVNAVYQMMAIKPDEVSLKDTLAILYFNSGRYVQTILIGREIIENNPEKYDIMEALAISEQSLGLLKESLNHYELLFNATKKLYFLYQEASIQYGLKRLGECAQSINALLATEGVEKEEVSITYGQNGESQKVPMNAAAYNLQGVVLLELNRPEDAKTSFEQAIDLFKDFVLAKANLDIVNKKINGSDKNGD